MSTSKPSKAKNLSLRLSDAQEQEVRAMAENYKVSQTKIIEWALDALSDYYKAHNGRVALPIDFSELWSLASKIKPSSQGLNEQGRGYKAPKKGAGGSVSGNIQARNAAAPFPTYSIQRKAHILEPLTSGGAPSASAKTAAPAQG